MSCVYIMYSVGDSIAPCGVPLCRCIGGPVYVPNCMEAVLSFRKSHRSRVRLSGKSSLINLYFNPPCHTLSNAFDTSRSITLFFLRSAWLCAISSHASAMACSVPLCCLKPYWRLL